MGTMFSPMKVSREMSRLFDDMTPFSWLDRSPSWEGNEWHPHVDIREDERHYMVIADLPGVDPKDVEVNLDGQLLTIRGERNTETRYEKEGFSRRERFSGTFTRQFTLPSNVNADAITAKANNGVLEVCIPKNEGNQPQAIKVES